MNNCVVEIPIEIAEAEIAYNAALNRYNNAKSSNDPTANELCDDMFAARKLLSKANNNNPYIGQPATYVIGSDYYAYTVTEVLSDATIVITKASRVDNDKFVVLDGSKSLKLQRARSSKRTGYNVWKHGYATIHLGNHREELDMNF